MVYDVLIAGAGVVGGMVARELSKYNLAVCILEKENDVACGASKANSGIIHGGYDPMPGTLKAKLNVEGVPLLYQAAEELNVPYRRNGSLIVAFGTEEERTLRKLYDRGIENGVNGMSIISGEEARRTEPNISSEITGALVVSSAGIICPYELTIAAVGNAMDNGVELRRNFEIVSVDKNDDIFTVNSANGESIKGRFFVNCAGTAADKVASFFKDDFFKIIFRAGEYLLLDKTEGGKVSHTIFRVPTEKGKGILVSPTVDGNLITGPTATEVFEADDKRTTPSGMESVMSSAKESVPSIEFRKVITSFAGVRASEKDGDFIIRRSEKVKGLVHAAAIDSPGLTSCVSIARLVADLLRKEGLVTRENPNWNGIRKDPHAFRKMSDAEKDEYIKGHVEFGKIVCRCETVSEGEIRAALRENPIPYDIDGIKRRTRSGMGRCQGGFCSPSVMRIISEELGIPLEEVSKKGKGSEFVIGKM